MAVEVRPLGPPPDGPVAVRLAARSLRADDFRLAHKTSDRSFYDDPRAASGAFEVAFTDKDGWLTEGSFTSLFVMKNGKLATPPLSRGVLPGVLRARLLAAKDAKTGQKVYTRTSFFFVCQFVIPGIWGIGALATLGP